MKKIRYLILLVSVLMIPSGVYSADLRIVWQDGSDEEVIDMSMIQSIDLTQPEVMSIVGKDGGTLRSATSRDLVERLDFTEKIPTSDEQAISTSRIRIYPNPVKMILNVEGLNNGTLAVLNLQGAELFSVEAEQTGHTTVDVSSLPNGTYLLKAGKSRMFKFIKE
ncbi:MAG: T9SS type A sorting domain-containing protein [Paludibacteraceae bacterium]|nr:T9SS type A sorting domain-containing protein [Paludibacteraceae bacterium]